MRMTLVFVTLVLTVGCGGYTGPYHCDTAELGRVWSEEPVNCGVVQQNATLAKWAMTEYIPKGHRTPLLTDAQFADVAQTPILMVKSKRVSLTFVGTVDGSYSANRGIETEEGMGSVVHELLHAKDWSDGILWSEGHPRWDVKGYNDASNTFWAYAWNAGNHPRTGLNPYAP